jgi:hypothetical protein
MSAVYGNGSTVGSSRPAEHSSINAFHFIANDHEMVGEQLSFIPAPAWAPTMPDYGTNAYLALVDLTQTPLTQPDWLAMGRGWRLAAAFKHLGYLGWPLDSEWVRPNGRAHPIKRYRLKPEGMRLALLALNGGQHVE